MQVSIINMDAQQQRLTTAIKARNSQLLDERLINSSSFILVNKYGDIWFHDEKLPQIFEQAVHLYFSFFQGPKVLHSLDHLLLEQGRHG